MFRKNVRQLQIPLTSHVDELPTPLRERLQNSWAETFYREFFAAWTNKPLPSSMRTSPPAPTCR